MLRLCTLAAAETDDDQCQRKRGIDRDTVKHDD